MSRSVSGFRVMVMADILKKSVSHVEMMTSMIEIDKGLFPSLFVWNAIHASYVIFPRRLQACQDDCSASTKSVAMKGGCASAPPHSALSKKARPLGFSEPSPLTYS